MFLWFPMISYDLPMVSYDFPMISYDLLMNSYGSLERALWWGGAEDQEWLQEGPSACRPGVKRRWVKKMSKRSLIGPKNTATKLGEVLFLFVFNMILKVSGFFDYSKMAN